MSVLGFISFNYSMLAYQIQPFLFSFLKAEVLKAWGVWFFQLS